MAGDLVKDIVKLARTQGAFFSLLTVFLFAILFGFGVSAGNWVFKLVDTHLQISKQSGLPPPDEAAVSLA